nr:uncharacterized protein LOC127488259 [Oryctolagus cuniculus]XP_051692599.1 uncharacterized protein LOC127488259 [Oryctolagus cuniculus]XP_051692600.1 uncharacterized protein LOC127488259 [Oryctolagus cuniculus]XP_051692601.1 uncharacterized protein LOC127488259 [Oryctolagus cuniculus]
MTVQITHKIITKKYTRAKALKPDPRVSIHGGTVNTRAALGSGEHAFVLWSPGSHGWALVKQAGNPGSCCCRRQSAPLSVPAASPRPGKWASSKRLPSHCPADGVGSAPATLRVFRKPSICRVCTDQVSTPSGARGCGSSPGCCLHRVSARSRGSEGFLPLRGAEGFCQEQDEPWRRKSPVETSAWSPGARFERKMASVRGNFRRYDQHFNKWIECTPSVIQGFPNDGSTFISLSAIRSQEPGASSRSSVWVQGPKDLGHPPLLSQATAELDRKWSSQDLNRCPYGKQAVALGHSAGPSQLLSRRYNIPLI